MIDPISITAMVAGILGAIFGGVGPLIKDLWDKLRERFGRACDSTRMFCVFFFFFFFF
jgi:hypothetical protein